MRHFPLAKTARRPAKCVPEIPRSVYQDVTEPKLKCKMEELGVYQDQKNYTLEIAHRVSTCCS